MQRYGCTAPTLSHSFQPCASLQLPKEQSMATMYFQRQHGLTCTLHACNNAIGAKVLVRSDLNEAADELALAMALRS